MRTFTYNGIDSDTYFFTHSIERQIMPPIDFDLKTIQQRSGALPTKSVLGVREIKIAVSVYGDSWTDLRTILEQNIAPWLYQTEDKELRFSDEPGRKYYAKLSGDTDLEELVFMGSAELTFVCSDPFKYNTVEKSILFGTGANPSAFTNAGTAICYPTIRIVPTADQATVKFTNTTNGKYILLSNVNGALNGWKIVMSDHKKNLIYDDTTKARLMGTLDITSDFFPLEVGVNNINMDPLTNMSARLIYTERYL